MSAYLLDAATELERLQLQARVWEPEAEALFARIGLPRGGRAVDVGCGAYGVLGALSRALGDGGHVVGVDFDTSLLGHARRHADEARLPRVTLVRGDAFRLPFADGAFDVAHARFMLAPLGRPESLARELIRVVRPGGVVIVEEPDAAAWNAWPDRPRFVALRAAITRAFAAAGGDFDAGRRTFALLRRLGLDGVSARAAVIAMAGGHPYLRLPVQIATSLRARLLDGIMTADELDAAIDECEQMARDPETLSTSFALIQTWGTKRA